MRSGSNVRSFGLLASPKPSWPKNLCMPRCHLFKVGGVWHVPMPVFCWWGQLCSGMSAGAQLKPASLGPFVSSKIRDKELISLGEMCPASKKVTASEIGVCRKGWDAPLAVLKPHLVSDISMQGKVGTEAAEPDITCWVGLTIALDHCFINTSSPWEGASCSMLEADQAGALPSIKSTRERSCLVSSTCFF